MKKTGRIILTAALMATTLVGCNSEKDKKSDEVKKQDEIIMKEPVCIYGHPEMFDSHYKDRHDETIIDEKQLEETPVVDEEKKQK